MTKPRALLLVAGLVLLCATAATARRTLLQVRFAGRRCCYPPAVCLCEGSHCRRCYVQMWVIRNAVAAAARRTRLPRQKPPLCSSPFHPKL